MKSIFTKIRGSEPSGSAAQTNGQKTSSAQPQEEVPGAIGDKFHWVRGNKKVGKEGQVKNSEKSASKPSRKMSKEPRELVMKGQIPKNVAKVNNKKLQELYECPRITTMLKESTGLEWNLMEFVKLGNLSQPFGSMSPRHAEFFFKNLSIFCTRASTRVCQRQKEVSVSLTKVYNVSCKIDTLCNEIVTSSRLLLNLGNELENVRKEIDVAIGNFEGTKGALRTFEELITDKRPKGQLTDQQKEDEQEI